MGDALLTYSVTPSSVPCSASETQLSIVEVTITAKNATSAPVAVSEIDIEIAGGGWNADDSLTWDPTSIVAAPDNSTPWAICGDTDGHWRAFPLPPATSIAARDSIAFVFSSVVVNLIQSPAVPLTITETSAGGPATATVNVGKTVAVGPYGGVPAIGTFTVDGSPQDAKIAPGQTVTFNWTVANVDVGGRCQLVPGSGAPVALTPPGSGQVSIAVTETTVFTLEAIGTGGSAGKQVTVAVMPVALGPFTASPATVKSGDPVTLDWSADYALTCSIDQKIGPVPAVGPMTVNPTETTVYTLTTTGLDPKQATASVLVAKA